MAELKVASNVPHIDIASTEINKREAIQKAVQNGGELENAALERCAEASSPDKLARQAYDRMYHTHNRG